MITIEHKKIGRGQPVFIIAEIGVNHEGDYDTCVEMVKKAAWAGADAIKLQTIDADENYVRGTLSWQLFKTCALTQDETRKIFDLSRELGMIPFTTSPDKATLQWVDDLGVAVHKVSSGMMSNDVIIRETASLGKAVLISTGMGTLEQIDRAVEIAKTNGADGRLGLFQCTSQYPVALDKINLASIQWMAERYGVPVGFSDHTKGKEAAMVATTLGATMIEKHFTLTPGRKVEIPVEENGKQTSITVDFDHHIGLSPEDFKAMVDGVRRAENMTFEAICAEIPDARRMVGQAEKTLPDEMQQTAAAFSRCLVARRPIKKGEMFTVDNVGLKRPFPDKRGLEPYDYDRILGQVAANDLDADEPIREESVNGVK